MPAAGFKTWCLKKHPAAIFSPNSNGRMGLRSPIVGNELSTLSENEFSLKHAVQPHGMDDDVQNGVVAVVHTGQLCPEAEDCLPPPSSGVSEDCTADYLSNLQRVLESMDQQHETSQINIEVRAPDQLGPIPNDTIAVVVKSTGFPYLSLDDLYDRIYGGSNTVKRIPLSQEPAKFTLRDHYTHYVRALRRRAWMEAERKEWAELMTRPIDAVVFRERLIHVDRSVVSISRSRAALKAALASGEYVRTRVHLLEGLADLKLYKSFYRAFGVSLQIERESQLNLLRRGVDVLKPTIRRLISKVDFDTICQQLGLNPDAECFCPVDDANIRLLEGMRARLSHTNLGGVRSQLNGTHGEETNSDDVISIRYFERDGDSSRVSIEFVYYGHRTTTDNIYPFLSETRDYPDSYYFSGMRGPGFNAINIYARPQEMPYISSLFAFAKFENVHAKAGIFMLILTPHAPGPDDWSSLPTYRITPFAAPGQSLRANKLRRKYRRAKIASQLNGTHGEATNEDDMAKGKGKPKQSLPKKERKAVLKAAEKIIHKQTGRKHKLRAKHAIVTPIGPRKQLVNGIVKGAPKDNVQEVLYTGVDETPKNFENPWFVFNASDQIKVYPVSLEGFASAFQVFPTMDGQPAQDVSIPPDLQDLLREYSRYRVGMIQARFEGDVASLFGGSMACMYVPSESPTYPASHNVNATYDFREMVKAKDHMRVPAPHKLRQFRFPPIPGSREVSGPESLLGWFVVWVREPYTTPNTSGPSIPSEVQVSSTPFSGKIGTFHVRVETLGQYRAYVSQTDRLFKAKTYELPFEPINPATITQLVSTDALFAPFVVAIPPEMALAVADTVALTKDANPSGLKTMILYRNGEQLTVQIPAILIPIAEAIAVGLGVPPGVATLFIEGVNALICIGTYLMDSFEDKTTTIQKANNQLGDGTAGTDIPAVTMSGIVTSNTYQPGLQNRNGITRTPASYTADSANSVSTNTTAAALWSTVNDMYHDGVRYLAYTWPESASMPVEIVRATVYESTSSTVPILKTVPAPTETTAAEAFAPHSLETFGIPAVTIAERIHEDQLAFAYGTGISFNFPTRQTAVFYQVWPGAEERKISAMAAPANVFVRRTGLYTFEQFPHMTLSQWQQYIGLKVLTPTDTPTKATTVIRMAYQMLGAVTDVANVWNLRWDLSTTFSSAYDTPSPYGVGMCEVACEDGSAYVDKIHCELLLKDTLGRGIPFITNTTPRALLYRFVMDF